MSSSVSTLRSTVASPARASQGSPRERLVVVLHVGVLTGLLASMAHYVTLHAELAPGWVASAPAFALVVVSGVLTKLLAQQMRTSAAAVLVACLAGLGFSVGFEISPYYLLGIDTIGGYAVVRPVGRAVLAFVGEQFPLQFLGYVLGVVYDGARA
ncbi:hypothetical protein [Halorarum salinum]|uniref:Uncharacterized protein n=1 Tax=Halorarum salinum TaxID=2743089 RepID=A0A7D5QEJ6_9EURY|nr:hypothetical protein [Halobaculum salinum]QLG62921.1 hypothetical protein HUG12_14755 [Halobaculum salinum]